jgi:hypothetical protein
MRLTRKSIHVIVSVAVFFMLLVVWPNLVHEQLHLLALKMQGLSGTISYDWHLPSHPTTTRIGQVRSVWGGMLFLLLPSVVSMAILFVCWLTRKSASIVFHVALPVYLIFDLVINVMKYNNPYSDFRFLSLVPWVAWLLTIVLMAFATVIVLPAARSMMQGKWRGKHGIQSAAR